MKTRLKLLRTLSPAEIRGLGLAWLCLLVAGLAIRVLPLPRIERLLARLAPARRVTPLEPGRLARLVGIAARHHLLPLACLPQSLALQALLRRQGVGAELRIGVRREDRMLRAHAWVEHAGLPVADPVGIGEVFLPLMQARSAS
jgi:Transglutaminase-like superfamily